MDKKKDVQAVDAPVSVRREAAEAGWGEQVGRLTVWALIGLLAAKVTIYGSASPFGVGAAAAASGSGASLVYIAVLVGYLLPGSTVTLIRYVAAVALAAGLRWVLGSVGGMGRRRWFAPASAGVAVLATGLAVEWVGGFRWMTLLTAMCEGLLAAGYAVLFGEASAVLTRQEKPEPLTVFQQISLIVVGAVALMSVAQIELAGISPGRIVAAVLILMAAKSGQEAGGAIAGTVLGAATVLASSGSEALAIAYGLGGLSAGLLARYGRAAMAGLFLAINLVAALRFSELSDILIGSYEALAAAVLFVAIPPTWEAWLHRRFAVEAAQPEAESLRRGLQARLKKAEAALHGVAGTVDEVSRRLADLSEPNVGSLFASLSEDVCRSCGLKMSCWVAEERQTMDALEHLLPILREHGGVSREDILPKLAARCVHIEAVAEAINQRYRAFCMRESAFRRLGEIRGAVFHPVVGAAELLGELSARMADFCSSDEAAAARVKAVCQRHGLTAYEATCLLDRAGRMTLEIMLSAVAAHVDREGWRQEIAAACGRSFAPPRFSRTEEGSRVLFTEKARFRIRRGWAQLPCEGERLCGDAVEVSEDDDGVVTAVLADGMGCGGRAAVDGAMAASLTSQLFGAGFGSSSVLKLVNAALMTQSSEESLSTLDVARIDRYSGRLTLLKAGATCSYLLSKGRLSRFDRASLPVGILPDIAFDQQHDQLAEGDLLVMISDGVLTDESAWLEEQILSWKPQAAGLPVFCRQVALAARQRQQRQDDITVLALLMERE